MSNFFVRFIRLLLGDSSKKSPGHSRKGERDISGTEDKGHKEEESKGNDAGTKGKTLTGEAPGEHSEDKREGRSRTMVHIVKKGDSLIKIARAYGVTLADLINANPWYKSDPDRINVGDMIEIPKIRQDPSKGIEAGLLKARRQLGKLSEKYETGGRGAGTVSGGVGDYGGVSYGSYQMTSRGGGTAGKFVSQPDFRWKEDFKDLEPGTRVFSEKWKELAGKYPDDFFEAQHAYIKKTHFDPLAINIKNEYNLDITSRSYALQDVIWSTAVQHGPYTAVVKRALETLKKGKVLDISDSEFDKKLIKAIYAERGRKNDKGILVYFSKNSPDVQRGVAKRFVNEEKDALDMLEDEKETQD